MEQKSNVNMQSTVVTVNYRKNSYLKEHGVSFHWWRESETSMHRHDFYEFFIMTDGATRHELNGDTAILKKGALVMLTPEDAHQFRRIGERSSIHMNFCASPVKFYGICAAIGADVEALCAPGARRSVELTAEELGYFTTKAGLINMLIFDKRDDSADDIRRERSGRRRAQGISGVVQSVAREDTFAGERSLHGARRLCDGQFFAAGDGGVFQALHGENRGGISQRDEVRLCARMACGDGDVHVGDSGTSGIRQSQSFQQDIQGIRVDPSCEIPACDKGRTRKSGERRYQRKKRIR